jgi:hypothetical protein
MLLRPHGVALRQPLGLFRYLVLSIRNLAGEARKLAGQLPVTPTVESDLSA